MPDSTQVYTGRGDMLYVIQTDNSWDNLHVSFYNKDGGQSALQTGSGYVMQNIKHDVETGYWWYSVPIPAGAHQFSLNNGRNSDKLTARYDISEVSVSRYELESCSIPAGSSVNVSDTSFNNGTLSFTVASNGSATVVFNNNVAYYDKFSHSECTVNNFNGIKGIRVQYNEPVGTDTDTAEIAKSSLDAYLITADGKETAMTPAQKNSLSISWSEQQSDDKRFGDKFSDVTNQNKLEIRDPNLFSDGVYKLDAEYQGFDCEFDISFEHKDHSGSKNIRKVIFRADEFNRSYFEDSGSKTAQYEFVFTITNENGTRKIYKITHNGKVVSNAEITKIIDNVPEKLKIVEGYDLEFSNAWIRNGLEISGLDFDAVSERVLSAAEDETIEYTAKLQQTD